MLFKFILTLSIILSVLCLVTQSKDSPLYRNPCLTITTSLIQFTQCQSRFYFNHHSINNLLLYSEIMPTKQLSRMTQSILTNECRPFYPRSESRFLIVHLVYENDRDTIFCILTEKYIQNNHFLKGWGVLITKSGLTSALSSASYKNISKVPKMKSSLLFQDRAVKSHHIQSAHPISDGNTDIQSTHLFMTLPFKTLLLATRDRFSIINTLSDCILPESYYLTDASHSPKEPFNIQALMIDSIFNGITVQMHGKAEETCSEDIFVSAGLNYTSYNTLFGNKNNFNSYVGAIEMADRMKYGKYSFGTPLTSTCKLTATRNILGRVINGRDKCDSFGKKENPVDLSKVGRFVHIEQSFKPVNDMDYWIEIMNKTFFL